MSESQTCICQEVERRQFSWLCVTYRLTLGLTVCRHLEQSWKEQCETKRWAGNCLTFMLAVKLKGQRQVQEEKLNLTLHAGSVHGSNPN